MEAQCDLIVGPDHARGDSEVDRKCRGRKEQGVFCRKVTQGNVSNSVKSVAMRKKYISICVRCAAPRFCIREIKSGSLRKPSQSFHSTLGRVGRLSTIQQSHEAGAGVRHSYPDGRAPTSLRPVRQAMPPEGDLHLEMQWSMVASPLSRPRAFPCR